MSNFDMWIFLTTFLTTFSVFLYNFFRLQKKKRLQNDFFSNTLWGLRNKTPVRRPFYEKTKKIILHSRVNISVNRFFIISLVCAFLGGIFGFILTEFILGALAMAIAASFIPYLYLKRIVNKRNREISIQFAPMLKHMSNYLRSGNNLRQAIEKTALITDGELGLIMEKIIKALNGGGSINKVIQSVYEEVPIIEFNMFQILISIHNDMGGDLAESLDNLASISNEKKALRSELDGITKETKTSAYITAIIPTIMYLALKYTSPDYIAQLEKSSWGKIGITLSFAFIALGVIVVRKVSDIKVDKAYR